jgi:hypothetical protein
MNDGTAAEAAGGAATASERRGGRVCERNRPIASLRRIPDPHRPKQDARRDGERLARKAQRLGFALRLPSTDRPLREVEVNPEVAADGRTDVATIDWARRGAY